MEITEKKLLNKIAQVIYDRKGQNILALDLKGVSAITDYVVIAEGNVDRHVVAIAKQLIEEVEKIGEKAVFVEGLGTGDWVVIDLIGTMIHLFMPGLREKYRLEQLYHEGKVVDLEIDVAEKMEK